MTTFLVTGAAGFIGSNLCLHLLQKGYKVIALDNLSHGFQDTIDVISAADSSGNFTFINGDITDYDTCLKATEGVDYVLHQAALGSVPRSIEFPEIYNTNNITGTLNMLRASVKNKIKRFVYASSSSVYGDTPVLPKVETMHSSPKSPYGVSKLTTEHFGKVYWELYGLKTIGLRYFNVFGPRQNPNSQYAAVIPKFITCFINNESPTIYGTGEQTRDFTYITNVIQANVNACMTEEEDAFGQSFNIGCGDRISIKQLAENIQNITNSSAPINFADPRPGDVKDSLADIEKAKKLLHLKELVPLEEGLAATISWYKEQN